jgi:DUF4097 and DUF4098 domain-containing protein YvlB
MTSMKRQASPVPVMVTVMALAALPAASAYGATPVDREIDADPRGGLEVRNLSGSVEIAGWNRRSVHVTGTLADNVERLDLRAVGEQIVVEVILRDGSRSHDTGTSLKISAPQAHDLEVDTVSASITVRGIEGEQRLSSVSGSIDTEGFTADIDLKSVSGDVTARGTGREAMTRASAISGSIRLTGLAGQVEVEAVSGSVEVAADTLQRTTLASISGAVVLRGTLTNDARVEIASTSGRVDLLFGGEASAEYDLTSFSGQIRSCFGPPVSQSSNSGPQRRQRFREGTSSARVHANTMSGGISLCRE